jgi:hypothetical protein
VEVLERGVRGGEVEGFRVEVFSRPLPVLLVLLVGFPASKTVAAALVTVKPGSMRELANWLSHLPPKLVSAHLNIPEETLAKFPRGAQGIVPLP